MSNIKKQFFGQMEDGQRVQLFTLVNSNGMQVSITNYGGIITKIIVPDKDDKMGDVVLGYDSLAGYLENSAYFGAIIGRYANRIAKGKFNLNDDVYFLPINNGVNHLHGGIKGFDKIVWTANEISGSEHPSLELSYLSPDGECGYPGTVEVKVIYKLTEQNELCIKYIAITDKPTICNLTNHTYFNLKDAGKSCILEHKLMIDADYITPVDCTQIPTGELMPVIETPFDFSKAEMIGRRINEKHQQLQYGYDHNFVLNGNKGEMHRAAILSEVSSGRVLEVFTEEPGVQFYTGNYLDGTLIGKNSIIYDQQAGLCLETQHFPDSPNQPNFPVTILNPGETYKTTTVYKFSVFQ